MKYPFMKVYSSKELWFNISAGFKEIWIFPRCIGFIDRKHIQPRMPKNDRKLLRFL